MLTLVCTHTHTRRAFKDQWPQVDKCAFMSSTEGSNSGGHGQSMKLAPLWFGGSTHFPMLLKRRGWLRKISGLSSNWCFKKYQSFYDLHRLAAICSVVKLSFRKQRDRHFKYVFKVRLSLISPSTKGDVPADSLPSYTYSHSGMVPKILEWITMSLRHPQIHFLKKHKVIIHFTIETARMMHWPHLEWVTGRNGQYKERVWPEILERDFGACAFFKRKSRPRLDLIFKWVTLTSRQLIFKSMGSYLLLVSKGYKLIFSVQ